MVSGFENEEKNGTADILLSHMPLGAHLDYHMTTVSCNFPRPPFLGHITEWMDPHLNLWRTTVLLG